MTAGIAFEALNNARRARCQPAGDPRTSNDMSIGPPVGALNRYLAQLMSGQFYARARDMGKNVLKNAPPLLGAGQAPGAAGQGHGGARHAV